MKKDLFLRIKEYCDRSGISSLIDSSRVMTVGFSGGADSLFLLRWLKQTLPADKPLVALHLNHMLRGEQADGDEAFCRRFCESENIAFISEKADIGSIARAEKKGIEECARERRYMFFDNCRKELAKKYSVSEAQVLTATAHNCDDNMETVLFNAARGSGALGLSGIPPIRDGVIIRPVLCASSEEIRDFLKELGQEFMLDYTNAEDEYTRNRIRHRAVPVLKEINPNAQTAFFRMSEAIRADEEYLWSEAEKHLEHDRERGCAETASLADLPKPLLVRIIFRLYSEVSEKGTLSRRNAQDIIAFMKSGKTGELHLPDNITVRIGKNTAFVKAVKKEKAEEKSLLYTERVQKGVNGFSALGFVLSIYDININSADTVDNVYSCSEKEGAFNINNNIYNYLIKTVLNNDKIKGNLFVRNRREGDVYLLGGHHKKVKKLFCDNKVPLEVRDRMPLLCDDDGILWIPGFPARDGAAMKNSKGNGLIIEYYGNKES